MADAVHTPGMDGSAQESALARNYRTIVILAFTVAAIGVITMMASGPLYRMGILPLGVALQGVLRWGAYIAIGGVVLCLIAVGIAFTQFKEGALRRAALPLAGLVAGLVAAGTPTYMRYMGPAWAPIHEISTDLDNPPPFVDIVPLRASTKASNPPEYVTNLKRGDIFINVPEAQRNSYPDIQPVSLANVPPAEAFNRALEAVKDIGLTVVAAKPEEGRIEAFERSNWFGFYDDMVVRVAPQDSGSRIDIRSKSRVGGGDVGMNTLRIRKYVKALTAG
jgi:uncharacterized protein (DUF1499 family)